MALSSELQNKINDLKEYQNEYKTILDNSKNDLKNTIAESILNLMDNDDFMHNKKYNKYLTDNGLTDSATTKMNWLKSLSKDEQIALLAEYSIDAEIEQGHNDWEKKLKDAQENKDITKKAIAKKADELISSFRELEADHKKCIDDLKAARDKKDAAIQEKLAELAKLSQKNKSDNTESAKVVQSAIDKLTIEKEDLDNKIKDLEKQTSEYKKDIEVAISEIEEAMKKEGIYIGTYKGLDKKDENTTGNTTVNPQMNNISQGADQRKPSQIAKAMMKDYENLSPTEVKQMLEHSGYRDLANMTRNLGPLNRKKLQADMLNQLEYGLGENDLEVAEYKDSEGNVIIASQQFSVNDLKSLNAENIEKIEKIIRFYANEYENMSVYNKETAEKNMQYFKMAFLILESKDYKIDRFFRGFGQKNRRINDAIKELERFSDLRGKREDKKWEKNKSLREILKVKTQTPSTDRKRRLNRDGKEDIYR